MTMQTEFITIDFINYKFKRYPKIKIFIDGDLYEEVAFTKEKEQVKFPVSLVSGKHLLEIEHFDKTNRDTLFKNDKILQDTKFTIGNLNICSFDIPYTFVLKSVLKPDWTHLTMPEKFPTVLKQSMTVGPNGVWSLGFETPVDDWLINERKKATLHKLEKTVTYDSYEPSEDSIIDYQLTDFDRQLMKEIKELIK